MQVHLMQEGMSAGGRMRVMTTRKRNLQWPFRGRWRRMRMKMKMKMRRQGKREWEGKGVEAHGGREFQILRHE